MGRVTERVLACVIATSSCATVHEGVRSPTGRRVLRQTPSARVLNTTHTCVVHPASGPSDGVLRLRVEVSQRRRVETQEEVRVTRTQPRHLEGVASQAAIGGGIAILGAITVFPALSREGVDRDGRPDGSPVISPGIPATMLGFAGLSALHLLVQALRAHDSTSERTEIQPGSVEQQVDASASARRAFVVLGAAHREVALQGSVAAVELPTPESLVPELPDSMVIHPAPTVSVLTDAEALPVDCDTRELADEARWVVVYRRAVEIQRERVAAVFERYRLEHPAELAALEGLVAALRMRTEAFAEQARRADTSDSARAAVNSEHLFVSTALETLARRLVYIQGYPLHTIPSLPEGYRSPSELQATLSAATRLQTAVEAAWTQSHVRTSSPSGRYSGGYTTGTTYTTTTTTYSYGE